MIPLQLQPKSHIPLYVQLRDQLRSLVYSGDLRPGDRIPASRELAVQLGVHRTTVANAYADLESEGLIRGFVGRGTYISDLPLKRQFTPPPRSNGSSGLRWEALFADDRGDENLGRLMPDIPEGEIAFVTAKPSEEFFPVEDFRRCCNAVLKAEGRRILQLGSSDGYPPLKQALTDLLNGEGMALKPGQLLITDGCQQALDLLCKAFLRPGDSVVLENPTYPGAIAIFTGARVRCLGVPVETHAGRAGSAGMNLEALESVLMQNRVKLIVVTPDFQNPTGTTMPVNERRKLLEIASRFQVAVVEDHIYARLRFREKEVPSLKSLDRTGIVIHIDSFSKVAFPGMRVGWVVGPETVIERLRLVKQATDLHTDQLAQATFAEFLRRGYFEKHLAKMKKVYGARLNAIEKTLERLMPAGTEWTKPDGGMSVWVTLPAGLDAGEMLHQLMDRGVHYVPGRYFYLQNPEPNTLRLGFAGVDEKRIVRGIATLGEFLRLQISKCERGMRRIDEPAAARVALV